MELIVFDLDGTLLNRSAEISPYTQETLRLLGERGIAYTVATGRTLHTASYLLEGRGFELPQIYKNGVVIWHPGQRAYSHQFLLTESEIRHVLTAFIERDVTPFIFTLSEGHRHGIYHAPLKHDIERQLAKSLAYDDNVPVRPVSELPGDVDITNISAIGPKEAVEAVAKLVEPESGLVAYMGNAIEDASRYWIDIHHSDGSKGSAVKVLKEELGASQVLCFGDSDNDLSMFAEADESYAPENAKVHVQTAATAVIGHHDEEGIARFLRERFEL